MTPWGVCVLIGGRISFASVFSMCHTRTCKRVGLETTVWMATTFLSPSMPLAMNEHGMLISNMSAFLEIYSSAGLIIRTRKL